VCWGVVVGVEDVAESVGVGVEESVVIGVATLTTDEVRVVVDFPDELGIVVVLLVVTGASVTVFRYVVFDVVGDVLVSNVPVLE